MCMAMGPGTDMFDSTRIIAQNIYLKAKVSDVLLYKCARVLLLQKQMCISLGKFLALALSFRFLQNPC